MKTIEGIVVFITFLVGISSKVLYLYDKQADPRRRARRALRGISTSSIADLREGERVRICGFVVAGDKTLLSPVSNAVCVGFRVTVDARTPGGDQGSSSWSRVLHLEACESFRLRDATGEAICEGPFLLGIDTDDEGRKHMPASVYALLDQAKVPLGRDREFRFTEALLKPGDQIAVGGRAHLSIDAQKESTGYRQIPASWVLKGSDQEPVVLADVKDSDSGAS